MVEQRKRVRIYTTSTCHWCSVAKRHLSQRGIEYTEIDVSKDRAGLRQMVLMTGQYGVPVITVGEKAFVGWNEQEFERLMRS